MKYLLGRTFLFKRKTQLCEDEHKNQWGSVDIWGGVWTSPTILTKLSLHSLYCNPPDQASQRNDKNLWGSQAALKFWNLQIFIKTREYPIYHVKIKIFLIIFGQFVNSGLQKRWMLENMLETLEWESVASRHSAQNGRVSTNWPHFLNREIQCVFLRLLLQKLKQTPMIQVIFFHLFQFLLLLLQ